MTAAGGAAAATAVSTATSTAIPTPKGELSLGISYSARAARLVADVDEDPWGRVRPSTYETARVVSSAPWLRGDARRVAYLLDEQHPDGSWGEGPEPYRLVPTLSAVEALLSVLRRAPDQGRGGTGVATAAARGLAALQALPPDGPWPDTAAAEILVPTAVAAVNAHLASPDIDVHPVLGPWRRGPGLAVPGGYHEGAAAYVAAKYAAAGRLPVKFHHTYEGIAGHLPPELVPAADGLLGSSPAATAAHTAAAAGGAAPGPALLSGRAVRELEAVAGRYGDLFPEAAPILVFERLWVAAALARAGLPAASVPTVTAWVDRIYDPAGVRGAPGLMTDADDTAMAVLVASLVGRPHDPTPLELFHNGSHYDCYIGEDTGSVTANAHALQALGGHLLRQPGAADRYGHRTEKLTEWLIGAQEADGHWPDKWHASPYYATERCVTALAGHGGPAARPAVASAVAWTLDTQREDGSWGVWGGTAEETAYAVKILLPGPAGGGAGRGDAPRRERALDRAADVLRDMADAGQRHPALWHDKTLYAPEAMIAAEVLAARALLGDRSG